MAFKHFLTKLQNVYKYVLNNHPYATQGVQAGMIMGAGDVLAQVAIENRSLDNINILRTGQFTMLGTFLIGPTLRLVYGILDRKIKTQHPLKRALQKVACDQLLFAPIFNLIVTSAISIIQGYRGQAVIERVRENYVDIMMTNYCLWPAAQIINFSFVPLNYQVLYAQTVALGWNTYFSWKMSKHEVVIPVSKAM